MRLVTAAVAAAILLSPATSLAQDRSSSAASQSSSTVSVPRLIPLNGVFRPADGRPIAGVETVTFAVYADEVGGNPIWQETQQVAPDAAGQYSVLLGSTLSAGVPQEVFASGEARWLGMIWARGNENQSRRSRLTFVPYAVHAADAETLGGKPASAYALTSTSNSTGTTNAAAADPVSVNTVFPGANDVLPKYANGTDLIPSAIYESSGVVGINTTAPLDTLHVRFTNNTGAFTGYAVQNLGGTAASYSGMLFYDQNGALGQFQGFNNSTHEYRINNIATSGTINFMTGSTSRFKVANNGFIGIGNANPENELHIGAGGNPILKIDGAVNSTGNGPRLRWTETFSSDYGVEAMLDGGTDTLSFRDIQAGSITNDHLLVIDRLNGFIGIGTTTPAFPLEVVGSANFANGASSSYFFPTGGLQTGYSGSYSNVSIKASDYILANLIGAVSDARIKTVRGRSNGAADLHTLLDIEVTDFTFKDVVDKGSRPQKKVIAQQVEKIFPQAVGHTTDVVPDIYKKAAVNNGWIQLATDLKVGDRVRLITENGHRAVHEVLEVKKDQFRTDFVGAVPQVFVYGREVNDFRFVDYEAISMLNVSATQELNRIVSLQDTQIQALNARLAALEQQLKAAVEKQKQQ
jgi:endosialidase-like protein